MFEINLNKESKETTARHHDFKPNVSKTVEKFRIFERANVVFVETNASEGSTKVDETSQNSRTGKKNLYKILKDRPEIVSVEENVVYSRISYDRLLTFQKKLSGNYGLQKCWHHLQNKKGKIIKTTNEEFGKGNVAQEDNINVDEVDTGHVSTNLDNADKYVMERIVNHTDEEWQTLFCVRLQGYESSDETIELANNIHYHIIWRYWQRRNRRKHIPVWA